MEHDFDETGTCRVCTGSHETLTTDCVGRCLLVWELKDIIEGADFVASRGWIDSD